MRSFLTALALLLAAVIGTVALTAYVASQTVLSTHGSGQVISSALQQPALRHRILAEVVPGYETLPSPVQDELNKIAQNRKFDAAVKHVRVQADGTVQLAPLRHQLEHWLRAHGEAPAASILAAVGGPVTVHLPRPVAHRYAEARHTARTVAWVGGIVAVALLLLALLISRHRRRTLGGVGWTILASCAATAVLWWAIPGLAGLVSHQAWADALAAVAGGASYPTVISILIPVAVAGAIVLIVSFLLPRGRRG